MCIRDRNITGAVDALKAVAEEQEMHGYKIGYVTGDDLLDRAEHSRGPPTERRRLCSKRRK